MRQDEGRDLDQTALAGLACARPQNFAWFLGAGSSHSTGALSPFTGDRYWGATMNDVARQLRAQIPSSTDPKWLEQWARDAEGRTALCPTGPHSGWMNPARAIHRGLT
jgi:hypothetical protein